MVEDEIKTSHQETSGHEHHHSEHHPAGHKKSKLNNWAIFSCVLIVLLIVSVFTNGFNFSTGSKDKVADETLKFVNDVLTQGKVEVKLNSVEEKSGLYSLKMEANGQEIDTYVTKDGKLFFTAPAIEVETFKANANSAPETPAAEPKSVTKSDKPVVELFVMTYCPYGTQAEKGILPVLSAIGSKADVKIRFVHYFMHGDKEEQETYRQVCIREEQQDKFVKYLQCFLNASDSAGCLKSTGIDTAKLDTCTKDKAKTYYATDSELSKKYGVQGSPTLVINGGQADFYPRSADTALKTICGAFNKAPEACSQKLSVDNPSPGFGYGTAGDAAAATCG